MLQTDSDDPQQAPGERVQALDFTPDGVLLMSLSAQTITFFGTSTDGGALQITTVPPTARPTATEVRPAATATPTAGAVCVVTALGSVNRRSGPGTNFTPEGGLASGRSAVADGQTQGADGITWYRLTDGTWVRSDVVSEGAGCDVLPVVSG
jgi:hypothetical protein